MFRLYLLLFPWLLLLAGGLSAQDSGPVPFRASPALQQALRRVSGAGDSVDLQLALSPAGGRDAEGRIARWGRVLYRYPPVVLCRVPVWALERVVGDGAVGFADLARKPREELTTGAFDLTLNQISLVHHLYPAITGSGVLASVKEQRFDTADIDLLNRWVNTGGAASTSSTHASLMATIMAGGGNTSEFARGVARGAMVTSSDFSTLLPDPDSVYRRNLIALQNHAYGTGIENWYGADALAFDLSTWRNPGLLHVFSAGNQGTGTSATGTYAGIPGYANLTGSFKMSKNSVSVGALDSFSLAVPLSSRGPAYDGRVKPELMAYGEGGTSGAAAMVSGTALLLQQAFQQREGRRAPASLVKAALINSAVDIGAPGIDHTTGYGSLNAEGALQVVLQRRWIEDSVSSGQAVSYPLMVPPNAVRLKVTLAWSDTAAAVQASKALVNDLDLQLRLPITGGSWLPWVLDVTGRADSLQQPARRKVDTLNNVEVITLEAPPAGNYLLEIRGRDVRTVRQSFSIAWSVDTAGHFFWTYPAASDKLTGLERNVLRWQTIRGGTGTLEYAIDGGMWQPLATGIDLKRGYQTWTPAVDQKQVRLRMRMDATGEQALSDTFVVSRAGELQPGFDCPDSLLLFWKAQPVTAYRVYELGDRYLQAFMSLMDTVLVVPKATRPSLYFSYAPLIGMKEGRRSPTINYRLQGVGCYFRNLLAQLQDDRGELTTTLGTLHGVSQVGFLKWKDGAYRLLGELAPVGTTIRYTDSSLGRGINTYIARIRLRNGQWVYSETATLVHHPDAPVIVYPNPVRQGEAVHFLSQEVDEYRAEVYDATGRRLYRKELKKEREMAEGLLAPGGIYFVRILDRRGVTVLTQKLIVH